MNKLNTVEDILLDLSFRKWVLQQDADAEKQWMHYISMHPEKKELVDEARQLLLDMPQRRYKMSEQTFQTSWENIEQKISTRTLPANFRSTVFRLPAYAYYVAATLVGILIVSSLWLLLRNDSLQSYQTAFGETRDIWLPDSSQVTLNSNSTLSYDTEKFFQNRQIWVEGEAYFNIRKRQSVSGEAMGFQVITQNLTVEVLGTQFNVNTRRNSTRVVLTEGSVKLKLPEEEAEEVYMKPGEMVTYEQEARSLSKSLVNPEVHTAWTDNQLVFENTPVSEIVVQLEDIYGVEVVLQNKEVADRRYTGTFRDPDPDIILLSIKTLFDLEIERTNGKIILK